MRSRENFLETFGNEVAIQKVSFYHAQNDVKGWIQLFPDFLIFYFANKKCSNVTSNCHIGMRVSAFESSDNEKFIYFISWS